MGNYRNKSDGYYIEKLLPPIFGVIAIILNFNFRPFEECDNPENIVSKMTDVAFIIFGFLLTILTLIMQSNSGIKESGLYTRLVKLNRSIVWIALFIGFFSLIYYTIFTKVNSNASGIYFSSTFFFALSWLLVESINYISVFYKLVLNQKI